jgi:heat shock protein HslJ
VCAPGRLRAAGRPADPGTAGGRRRCDRAGGVRGRFTVVREGDARATASPREPPADGRDGAEALADAAPRTLLCGDLPIRFARRDGTATLTLEDRVVSLVRDRSAPGVAYEGDGGALRFRTEGVHARLRIDGEALPECTWIAARAPLRAGGNEPFWHLEVGPDTLRYAPMDPYGAFTAPRPEGRVTDGGFAYEVVTDAGETVELRLRAQPCADSMSGMPHPLGAELRLPGEVRRGCAGDPAWLLLPGTWRVRQDGTEAGAAFAAPTVDFRRDGTVGGPDRVQRVPGLLVPVREGLRVGPLATTRRACPESFGVDEAAFLARLEGVRRFRTEPGDRLVLIGPEGELVLDRDD